MNELLCLGLWEHGFISAPIYIFLEYILKKAAGAIDFWLVGKGGGCSCGILV